MIETGKPAAVLFGNAEKLFQCNLSGGMSAETQCDVGRLTQPLCTSILMMILTAEKHLNLNTPVIKYLPDFAEGGKEKATIKQLLKHTSGLPKTTSYLNEKLPKEMIIEKICYEEPQFPAAFEKLESDLGYIILGIIIEKITGLSLEQYFNEKMVIPLCLKNTMPGPFGHTGLKTTPEDTWKIVFTLLGSYKEKNNWIPKPVLEEFIGIKARYKLGFETGAPPFSSHSIGMSSDNASFWIDLEKDIAAVVFAEKPGSFLQLIFPDRG